MKVTVIRRTEVRSHSARWAAALAVSALLLQAILSGSAFAFETNSTAQLTVPLNVLEDAGSFTFYVNEEVLVRETFEWSEDGSFSGNYSMTIAGQTIETSLQIEVNADGQWTAMHMETVRGPVDITHEGSKAEIRLESGTTTVELRPGTLLFENFSPALMSQAVLVYDEVQGGKQTFPLFIIPSVVMDASLERLQTVERTVMGQHQMFTAQYFPFRRPRGFITSGGLGTMGFGLPAALGAKVGTPERDVVCVDGDGSFLMNIQELATAARYGIGVVVMVLNNSYLGMVRQWQDMFLDARRAETELAPPPYDQVAKAFGGLGRAIESQAELEPALDWALRQARERKLPVVLDVRVDREALVLPMVPPGGANAEFIPCEKED